MKSKQLTTSILAAIAASALPAVAEEGSNGGSWCQLLTDLGTPVYSNDDAMLIQAVKFFGRAQVQFASTDIDGIGGVVPPRVRRGR